MIGYTYMNPIAVYPDSVYEETNHFGYINPITFNNSSSDSTILKYRYQHVCKLDLMHLDKYTFGINCAYNDYMRNIDKVFTTPLVNEGIPQANIPPAIPGINSSRDKNKNGDFMIDMNFGVQFSKTIKLNFMVNNLLNAEKFSRPADIEPPRVYS